MNMQHECGSLNGSATLYLMVGRLQSSVEHLENRLETGLHGLSEEVEELKRTTGLKPPEPKGWIASLGLSGKEVLLLAFALGMGITGTVTPEQFRAILFGP